MNTKVENAVRLTPLIGGFLIFLGIVSITTYYINFNIRITNYLLFSEIITQFLDDLLLIGAAILMVSIFIPPMVDIVNKAKPIKQKREFDETNYLPLRILTFLQIFWPPLLLTGLIIIANAVIYILKKDFHFILLCIGIGNIVSMILFYFLFEFRRFYYKITGKKSSRNKSAIIFAFFLITFLIYGMSTMQAKIVVRNNSYNGTEITLDDNTILVSDSVSYYIGNTENYLFYYNQEEKFTEIYPMDRVIKMKFIENRK